MADEPRNDWERLLCLITEIEGQMEVPTNAKRHYDSVLWDLKNITVAPYSSHYSNQKSSDEALAAVTNAKDIAVAQAKEEAQAAFDAKVKLAADNIRALRVILPNYAAKACIALMMVADDVETYPCDPQAQNQA